MAVAAEPKGISWVGEFDGGASAATEHRSTRSETPSGHMRTRTYAHKSMRRPSKAETGESPRARVRRQGHGPRVSATSCEVPEGYRAALPSTAPSQRRRPPSSALTSPSIPRNRFEPKLYLDFSYHPSSPIQIAFTQQVHPKTSHSPRHRRL